MDKVIEQLKQLGFSQYEAQTYITLLQRNPLNGYELAKLSGIPRANVYAVLQKLEDRGAVVREDTDEGTRYAPVASEELIHKLGSQFQLSLDAARRSLHEIHTQAEHERIWNAQGYAALLEHAQTLIEQAEKELLIAVWPEEAQALSAHVSSAAQRGVAVTTLCMAGCRQNCGHCHGYVHSYPVASSHDARWLVLVPDRTEMLSGEIHPQGDALAVRTRQRLLVELANWYIRNTIALSALSKDIGSKFEDLLSPETLSILVKLRPHSASEEWLEQAH